MMAWEHLVLGDLEPGAISDFAQLEAHCEFLAELGRRPGDTDPRRRQDADLIWLPGSCILVTTGELNVLPDYFNHPDGIAAAPASFMVPLVQSIREQSLVQLRRITGHAGAVRLPGALWYSRRHRMSELCEGVQVTLLGKRCRLPEPSQYHAVVERNASHFAPLSWHRWRAFHRAAREMIARSHGQPAAEREPLRTRARIYAGYADHFLQDSFAAGHQLNKTLVMQWYAEWLTARRLPVAGRAALASMTQPRQPLLHRPDLYHPEADRSETDPAGAEPRLAACTQAERHAYLIFRGSVPVQYSVSVVHGHFNRRSLMVASEKDGPSYRIWGDRTMFTPTPDAFTPAPVSPWPVAVAASASRQAITELLHIGETQIEVDQIFAAFPRYVESAGELMSLPVWHEAELRALCLGQLFPRGPVPAPGLRSRKKAGPSPL
jgi:hypothetical protein